MNIVTQISKDEAMRLPFGTERKQPYAAARSATLSTNELKRIVAAMLG
ncbi:hypothetical protein NUH86_20750 [Sphingobium sp. JS3065]|nr:hypothetical protein [Sphingobium sp. JS3065]UZW57162.1 hypothetical protein NUH86_20750 [Sphingobium sp. JS3065]